MMPIVEKTGYSEFEWTVKAAKNGSPTLLFGNRAVHSQYNPQREAETLAKNIIQQAREEHADHIIMLGMGLGYLPDALFTSGWENLIIWDPFPKMQNHFPLVPGNWQKRATVTQFFHDVQADLQQFVRPNAKPKVICHQNYLPFVGYEYRQLLDFLATVYQPAAKLPIISSRSLEILERLPELGTIRPFQNHYKCGTAILIAPGPSLKEFILALQGHKDATLFAPVQAVPMLQQAGIFVDFIVIADPEDMSMFFNDVAADGYGTVLTEIASHPATLDWAPARTALFAMRSGQLYEKKWTDAGLPLIDIHGATVSELQTVLARYMGFDTLCCLGMDLCWDGKRYHGYRPPNDYDARNGKAETYFTLHDVNGRTVTTESGYFQASRFFNDYVQRPENSNAAFYQNATGLDKGMKPLPPGILCPVNGKTVSAEPPAPVNDRGIFNRTDLSAWLYTVLDMLPCFEKKERRSVFAPSICLQNLPSAEAADALKRLAEMFAGRS